MSSDDDARNVPNASGTHGGSEALQDRLETLDAIRAECNRMQEMISEQAGTQRNALQSQQQRLAAIRATSNRIQETHARIREHDLEARAAQKRPMAHDVATDRVHEPSPKEDVIQTDGLFGLLASFCDCRTMLRLCTLTSKAKSEHRSHLAMALSLPKDPRRTAKIVNAERWADVLRECLVLDRPCPRVTAMHPFCESIFAYRNQAQRINNGVGIVDMTSVENDLGVFEDDDGKQGYYRTIEGAICAGPYIMREGVHCIVVDFSNHRRGFSEDTSCFVGIARPELARKEPYCHVSHGDEHCSNKSDFVASAHTEFGRGFYGGCELRRMRNGRYFSTMGVELDLDARMLKFYELNEDGRWSAPRQTALNLEQMEDIGNDAGSNGPKNVPVYRVDEPPFCWAVETGCEGDQCEITRHTEPFVVGASRFGDDESESEIRSDDESESESDDDIDNLFDH